MSDSEGRIARAIAASADSSRDEEDGVEAYDRFICNAYGLDYDEYVLEMDKCVRASMVMRRMGICDEHATLGACKSAFHVGLMLGNEEF